MALATLYFGLSIFSYGVMFVPFIFVLFMTGIALGIFGAGMLLRYGPSAEWLVWPIPALLSPFAGVFYPVSVLPSWMQTVAHALPPSYVFENIRALAAGKPADVSQLATGIGLCFVYIALATLYFYRTYRKAVQQGLIARYSAEGMN
jgi:ABC-2 type transport system permease protein